MKKIWEMIIKSLSGRGNCQLGKIPQVGKIIKVSKTGSRKLGK